MARPTRQWTPEEDAALRSYPAKGLSRLALEMRASEICIRRRLIELGVPIRTPGRPKSLPLRSESDFGSDEHYYGTDMKV